MSENNALHTKLTNRPRLLGTLFTLSALLMQFGAVMAGGGGTTNGP